MSQTNCKVCDAAPIKKTSPYSGTEYFVYDRWFLCYYPYQEGTTAGIILCPDCARPAAAYINALKNDRNAYPDELWDCLLPDV